MQVVVALNHVYSRHTDHKDAGSLSESLWSGRSGKAGKAGKGGNGVRMGLGATMPEAADGQPQPKIEAPRAVACRSPMHMGPQFQIQRFSTMPFPRLHPGHALGLP